MMTSADAGVLVFGLRTGEGVPGGGLLSPSGKEQSLGRWSPLPWVPGKGDLRAAAVMVGDGGASILIPSGLLGECLKPDGFTELEVGGRPVWAPLGQTHWVW